MSVKFLPSLKSLKISNFSLYPGNLNLTYDFVEGVNLIIGGNGVGKTTFLNIIKYALIGLYKKGVDVKRREYKGKEFRYEKRSNLPYYYFSKRMDQTFEDNNKAEVTLKFDLNETTFEVTRNLYDPCLTKFSTIKNGVTSEINGRVILQSEFDNIFSDKTKDNIVLSDTLQWKYEEAIGTESNLEFFDSMIFLVNDILFFSESRTTIMWDGEVQNRLSSKFLTDPQLDDKKEELERERTYQNSLARHKSEDIRAIRKILSSIEDSTTNSSIKDLLNNIEEEKKFIEASFNELEKLQTERTQQEVILNKLYSDKNLLNKKLDDLEKERRQEEEVLFSNIFKKVTPKYLDYSTFLKSTGDCPLCNNKLATEQYLKVKDDDVHCILCYNEIKKTELSSSQLSTLNEDIGQVLGLIRIKEKTIFEADDLLKNLDNRFRQKTIKLNESQSKLRQSEFALQKLQVEDPSKIDTGLQAMQYRILELEIEKETAQNKSNEAKEEVDNILAKIDSQRLESREKLSEIFEKFGSRFLGVRCELVYEDPGDEEGKRYLPRIGGIDRLDPEELSESQRFFIDQSFRMSVLNYFNKSSSFFMCETPDSSLDISYEKNAAKIFLEYIKNPNELILTSNLNNSEFLDFLIDKSNSINFINLLKIGKQSAIQSASQELLNASIKIENKINGKRNKK